MAKRWAVKPAPPLAPRRQCAICGKRFPLYLIKDGRRTLSYTRRRTCSRRCASDLASTSHELRWEGRTRTSAQIERCRASAVRGAAQRVATAAARYSTIAASPLSVEEAIAYFCVSRATVYRARRIVRGGNR